MKRPIMIGRDKGKGTNNEIARLIPSEIPIHISCCIRNCLLLLNTQPPSLYSIAIHYIHYCNLNIINTENEYDLENRSLFVLCFAYFLLCIIRIVL